MPSLILPGGSHRRHGAHSKVLARKLWGGGLLFAASAASQPVLHEHVDLGSGSQLLEPTIVEAQPAQSIEPAAAATRAASTDKPIDTSQFTEGAQSPQALDGSQTLSATSLPHFAIDRDTSRPEEMDYEDPFTPTIAPFKRSVVYDEVDAAGSMAVFDPALVPLPQSAITGPNDETFHAAWDIELVASQAAALPSVAPGARWAVAQIDPPVQFELLRDSADNWFVRTDESGQYRLTVQVAGRRDVFGSDYPDVPFEALEKYRRTTPESVRLAARSVAATLGLGVSARPRKIVRTLIRHFRSFQPSKRVPQGRGLQLFRELALGGRGICRHRAYSFAVLAIGLGVPTRYAMNEAHAWVEVFDGSFWHRIDLGGAAGRLTVTGDTSRPEHVPSLDPYAWPPDSHSGQDMASAPSEPLEQDPEEPSDANSEPFDPEAQSNAAQSNAAQPRAQQPGTEQSNTPAEASAPIQQAEPVSDPMLPSSQESSTQIELSITTHRTARGRGLRIVGRATQDNSPCAKTSINISLLSKNAEQSTESEFIPELALGTLVTQSDGKFGGQLVIPWTVAVGDYRVVAHLASGPGGCLTPAPFNPSAR